MGDRQPAARYSIRRWADIPYMHVYEFADDVYDQIHAKFEALFEVYEEQYERTLVENQSIADEILEPLKDYFLTAKTICGVALSDLYTARMFVIEELQAAHRAMVNVYEDIVDTFREVITTVYEMGREKLLLAFIAIESHCWRFGFGDATEQWVEFINGDTF